MEVSDEALEGLHKTVWYGMASMETLSAAMHPMVWCCILGTFMVHN